MSLLDVRFHPYDYFSVIKKKQKKLWFFKDTKFYIRKFTCVILYAIGFLSLIADLEDL